MCGTSQIFEQCCCMVADAVNSVWSPPTAIRPRPWECRWTPAGRRALPGLTGLPPRAVFAVGAGGGSKRPTASPSRPFNVLPRTILGCKHYSRPWAASAGDTGSRTGQATYVVMESTTPRPADDNRHKRAIKVLRQQQQHRTQTHDKRQLNSVPCAATMLRGPNRPRCA